MVVFSFMGSEIVTLAAGEAENPRAAVTKATNSVIWRIAVFYLGSILVVVSLLRWDDPAIPKDGSYVAALNSIGIPHAGQIMNPPSGAIALFVWLVICFSQLRMRRIIQRETLDKLLVRMWLYPYLTWATIAMITFVLCYMLTDTADGGGRDQVVLSTLVAVGVVGVALLRDRLRRNRTHNAVTPS